MGTTKLTRKEILAEDPVHHAMMRLLELLRERGNLIAAGAGAVVLIALGIYFGIQYLERREVRAQDQLSRGMDFYHARIDPAAPDDPYAKGGDPLFRTEEAKYKAAAKEFAEVVSSGPSTLAVMARYYLGLTQLQLGQKDEAVRSLEAVRSNTASRTVAYLAKKVLANHYLETGNSSGAVELLEGMIKDPQCELPRASLQLDLARALETQGKRDQAIKVLREARRNESRSMLLSQVIQELNRLEGISQ
ncbi:MAG: tetratricopeptide repeat protein [Acidobacteria bacterium]|nr:tetratricopeptide repeat protein [Acidobacteriota bacterium]